MTIMYVKFFKERRIQQPEQDKRPTNMKEICFGVSYFIKFLTKLAFFLLTNHQCRKNMVR